MKLLRNLFLCLSILSLPCCSSGDKPGDKSGDAGGKAKAESPPAVEAEPFMKDIDAATAGKLVNGENPPTVIDVRTPQEFAEGHIQGAINIDFNSPDFKDELAKLSPDKTYLMHCRSGNRSNRAKPAFKELGFEAIYHLDGGMIAWEEAGLPTAK